ncbi:helix-turn-helix transcriptional regulator [Microbacterium sp. CFBP9023]|uniref:helix-turn-helix transcriptional regulator n=1 Tax=Microbacterium sp. CFBP9023 TaxID=3096535 RepID=UPI0039C9DAB3
MLRTKEAAAYCGISAQTLRNLLSAGDGPRCFKQGRPNAFRRPDLESWVDSRLRSSSDGWARRTGHRHRNGDVTHRLRRRKDTWPCPEGSPLRAAQHHTRRDLLQEPIHDRPRAGDRRALRDSR